ncbi:MAG: cupin domain-containing protein [Candidatus Omnitrophota bacterium]|jgi:quercetin dioxygenase-like cupin family protein
MNDHKEKALQLVSLVDYQENSVVSKQLLDKKSGTLTLFAFDAGQGLSEHTAPYDAVILVIDGRAVPIPINWSKAEIGAVLTTIYQKKIKVRTEILIGGKSHEVSAGQMIIMPANVPHAVKARGRFKMLLVMIKS